MPSSPCPPPTWLITQKKEKLREDELRSVREADDSVDKQRKELLIQEELEADVFRAGVERAEAAAMAECEDR